MKVEKIVNTQFKNFDEFKNEMNYLFVTTEEQKQLMKELNKTKNILFIDETTILITLYLPRKKIISQIIINNLTFEEKWKIFNKIFDFI